MRSGFNFDLNYLYRTIPVTIIFISLLLASLLLVLLGAHHVTELLLFTPASFPQALTGLVTYPLAVGNDFVNVILSAMMIFWFAGSLERDWGSRRFLIFLLGATAASALCWWLGMSLLALLQQEKELDITISGAWLSISSIMIAWVILNPRETVMVWMLIPVKASWIGWGTLIMLYLFYPYQEIGASPGIILLGLFALGGAAFAWFFVHYQQKWGWVPRRKNRLTINRGPTSGLLARWQKSWQEMKRRRRVKKLQRTFRLDD